MPSFPIPPLSPLPLSLSSKFSFSHSNVRYPSTIPPPLNAVTAFTHSPLPMPRTQSDRCMNSTCTVCKVLACHSYIRSHSNNSLFPIDTSLHCLSSNIISALTCTVCSKQYVGQTSRTARHRLAGHRHHFKYKHKSLYYHFTKHHHIPHLHVNITLIERVEDPQDRLRREAQWIQDLGTLLPKDLNVPANLNQLSPTRTRTSSLFSHLTSAYVPNLFSMLLISCMSLIFPHAPNFCMSLTLFLYCLAWS